MKPQIKTSVGWIGVGAMGLPMCTNLVRGGVQVVAFDRMPERLALAAHAGVKPATTVGGVAQAANVVFSMVFDDAALEGVVAELVEGPSAMTPGGVFIDMSTVSPDASSRVAQQLAQHGIRYLRAPVSGSVPLAQAATITVLASGERADYESVRSLLALLSREQRYVGTGEAARVVKLAINLMVATSTALIGEALALGERQGVSRDVMVDALNASIVGSRHYEARAASMKSRTYNSNGPVHLIAKDMGLATRIAQNCGLHLAFTETVQHYLQQLLASGQGDTEVTVLAEHVQQVAEASTSIRPQRTAPSQVQ